MIHQMRIVAVFLFATVSLLARGADLPASVTLFTGESRVLMAPGAERIAVGNTNLVSSALLKGGEVVLTADAEGETNMLVWFADGTKQEVDLLVVQSNGFREAREIRQMLANVPGVIVRNVGRRVVIDGSLDPRDLEKVNVVQETFPNVIVLAQATSDFSQKMIYFDVRITEFSKDATEELGINWSTSASGPYFAHGSNWSQRGGVAPDFSPNSPDYAAFDNFSTLSGVGAGTYWGIATEITSRINFLESTGAAITLASPRLSARSGGTAQLTVGGQVPVVTSSLNGPSVEYKDFGILLSIEPRIDPYGNIVARIATEISALDKANQVQEFPAFKTRRSDNDVRMRPGQSLVLSGLISEENQVNYDKVKWLGDVPILGNLFKSKSFTGGKTELVIFITPTVLEDMTRSVNQAELDRHDAMKREFQESFGQDIME